MLRYACLLVATDGYDWPSIMVKVFIIIATATLGLSDEIRDRFFTKAPEKQLKLSKPASRAKDRIYVGVMMSILVVTLLSTYWDTEKSMRDSRDAAKTTALSERRQQQMDSLLLVSTQSLTGIIHTSDSINKQNQAVLSNTQRQLQASDSIAQRIHNLGQNVARNMDRLREPIQGVRFSMVLIADLKSALNNDWYNEMLSVYRQGEPKPSKDPTPVFFVSKPFFNGEANDFSVAWHDSLLMISRADAVKKGGLFEDLSVIDIDISITRDQNEVLSFTALNTLSVDSANQVAEKARTGIWVTSKGLYGDAYMIPGDQVVIDLKTKQLYLVLKGGPGVMTLTDHELASPLDFYDKGIIKRMNVEVYTDARTHEQDELRWIRKIEFNNVAEMTISMSDGRYEFLARHISGVNFPLLKFVPRQ